jgi:hypothetical protein
MTTIINSILTFITQILALAFLASGICLFAGEVRLAAHKKAAHGSSKLSTFTKL